jgi:hypothetical protein
VSFYEGKIATSAFFAANMLPRLSSIRAIIDDVDTDLMSLPEGAF